jgi:hypothetical protein
VRGDGRIPRNPAAAAGPLLALLLILANVLPVAGAPGSWPVHAPVRSGREALALAVPGLYEEAPLAPVLGKRPPPRGGSLARAAWVPAAADPVRLPYVGIAPLLLAAVALLGAAGRGPWALRALLLLGLLLGAWPGPMGLAGQRVAGLLFVAALAGLAGVGLSGCSRPLPGADSAPPASGFALAALAVLVAAALTVLAVRVGASADRAALEGLLPRAAAREWSPGVLAANAAWLGALLDRAALAAFASMTVLLLHLKARRPWSLALVVAVSLADAFTLGRI